MSGVCLAESECVTINNIEYCKKQDDIIDHIQNNISNIDPPSHAVASPPVPVVPAVTAPVAQKKVEAENDDVENALTDFIGSTSEETTVMKKLQEDVIEAHKLIENIKKGITMNDENIESNVNVTEKDDTTHKSSSVEYDNTKNDQKIELSSCWFDASGINMCQFYECDENPYDKGLCLISDSNIGDVRRQMMENDWIPCIQRSPWNCKLKSTKPNTNQSNVNVEPPFAQSPKNTEYPPPTSIDNTAAPITPPTQPLFKSENTPCDVFDWYKSAPEGTYIKAVNTCVAKVKLPDRILNNSEFKGNTPGACKALFDEKRYSTGEAFVHPHYNPAHGQLCVITGRLDNEGNIIMPGTVPSPAPVARPTKPPAFIPPDFENTTWTEGSRICKQTHSNDFPCVGDNKWYHTESEAIKNCSDLPDCSYIFKKNFDGIEHFYLRRASDPWMPDSNGSTMYVP